MSPGHRWPTTAVVVVFGAQARVQAHPALVQHRDPQQKDLPQVLGE